jgi:hypothetical protein
MALILIFDFENASGSKILALPQFSAPPQTKNKGEVAFLTLTQKMSLP